MGMLLYMPWCPIDFEYRVGDIRILPFDLSKVVDSVDSGTWSCICAILGTHKDITGKPVDHAALVQFDGKSLLDDLADDDVDNAADFIKSIALDGPLLNALVEHRAAASEKEWGRWQNSLTAFNLANTDGDNFRKHVEWVLLCSAFEHLLKAKPNAKDVARLLDDILVPAEAISAPDATRPIQHQEENKNSLRYEWMREFYSVRGDFAHGKLISQHPMTWNSQEHLILGTIAFPLVVKALLKKAGKYELTEDDVVQIDCFEKLAEMPDFFLTPHDEESCSDSHWTRLCEKRKSVFLEEGFKKACLDQLKAR